MVQPVTLYSSKCWPVLTKHKQVLNGIEMKMMSKMMQKQSSDITQEEIEPAAAKGNKIISENCG